MTTKQIDCLRSTLRAYTEELRQLREDLGAKLSEVYELVNSFDYDDAETLDNEASEETEALLDVLNELADDADTARECIEEIGPACC
jgi:uncharacterized coiled-coil DUF342 family protein